MSRAEASKHHRDDDMISVASSSSPAITLPFRERTRQPNKSQEQIDFDDADTVASDQDDEAGPNTGTVGIPSASSVVTAATVSVPAMPSLLSLLPNRRELEEARKRRAKEAPFNGSRSESGDHHAASFPDMTPAAKKRKLDTGSTRKIHGMGDLETSPASIASHGKEKQKAVDQDDRRPTFNTEPARVHPWEERYWDGEMRSTYNKLVQESDMRTFKLEDIIGDVSDEGRLFGRIRTRRDPLERGFQDKDRFTLAQKTELGAEAQSSRRDHPSWFQTSSATLVFVSLLFRLQSPARCGPTLGISVAC
jgi:hypothetical protein